MHFLWHFQMFCNSSRFISCDSITSNASHSTLGILAACIWVYLVRSDHSGPSLFFFLCFCFLALLTWDASILKCKNSTQCALGLSSMPQPFKDGNTENTLKNTCQPISGLLPVSGECETLISVWAVLISLTVNQIHTPHPLYMAPRIHPSAEKQLLSTLPFG